MGATPTRPPPIGPGTGPTGPGSERRGWSTGAKVAAGIGCGAVVVLLVGALALGVGFYWLFATGEQVASGVVLSEDVLGYARLQVEADDPGVQELLAVLAVAINEGQRRERAEQLPENLRFLSELQQQTSSEQLGWLWPRDVTFALWERPGDEPVDFAGAVNLSAFGGLTRLVGRFLEQGQETAGSELISYRGHTLTCGENACFTLSGSTILVATRGSKISAVIDRIEEGGGPAAASQPLEALAERLAAGADLYAVSERPSRGFSGPTAALEAVQRIGAGLDLVSADLARGELVLVCDDTASLERTLEAWPPVQASLEQAAAQRGLSLRFEPPEPEGPELRVPFELVGIGGVLVAGIESAYEVGEAVAPEAEAPAP